MGQSLRPSVRLWHIFLLDLQPFDGNNASVHGLLTEMNLPDHHLTSLWHDLHPGKQQKAGCWSSLTFPEFSMSTRLSGSTKNEAEML